MESIDRTLGAIFGESGKRAILYHIKRQCGFEADDIVQKPKEFADALESMLGIGGRVIEEYILKNVYKDFGLDYEEAEELNFKQRLKYVIAQGENKT